MSLFNLNHQSGEKRYIPFLALISTLTLIFMLFIYPPFRAASIFSIDENVFPTGGFHRMPIAEKPVTYIDATNNMFVDRSITPGNFFSPRTTIFSSRIDGDRFQGEFVSPWYPTSSAGMGAELLVGGWINRNPDLHLYLEIDDDGVFHSKRYEGKVPGPGTRIWRIGDLGSEGQRYRIVAKDLSSASFSWLSVSLPQSEKNSWDVGWIPFTVIIVSVICLLICIYYSVKKIHKLLIFVVLITCYTFCALYPAQRDASIISDGAGYYVYLTAAFIDNDLSLKTRKEKHNYPTTFLHYYPETDKYNVAYTCGLPILQLPFFFSAYALSTIVDSPLFPVNGYSYYFQVFVNLASLFYLLAGLIFLYKILRKFVDDFDATLITAIILFGTNLFSYAAIDASFTHVYSFTLIALFVLLTTHFYETDSSSRRWALSIAIGALLGIIAMLRTVNIIIVFFFIFYGFWKISDFKAGLKTYFWHYLAAALTSVVFFLPQMLYWRYTAGSFLINSYGDTSLLFSWTSPFVKEVLFSIKNGLLFWTPIWILAPVGLFFICRYDKKWFFPLTAVLLIHLYITSSWTCWWYGGGFGMRPFIDILPVLAICLAGLIKFLKARGMRNAYKALMAGVLISGLRNVILMLGFWFGTNSMSEEIEIWEQTRQTYSHFWPNFIQFIQNAEFPIF
ncbi:hypothetical protein C4J81_19250 (plasmid) [Deltaproteobacteria bacterium Smac51]|nr:hypothetical protein C4J81_19250 [Deltaproteobacteria bacterium Smac51]